MLASSAVRRIRDDHRSHAMYFNVDQTVSDPLALLGALRAHDAFAQIEIDAVAGTVRVLGQLGVKQAKAAFAQVGLDAQPMGDSPAAHVSGGSTCCGHCA
jgi:copper chaperone